MTDITIRQMLEAGSHFGHQVRFWNPKMAPYIFGIKNKIHIINLEQTLPLYQEAVNFLSSIAAKKGKILFVGTKHQARNLICEEAKRCQMPYVNYRWLGGMLTNYKTIRQSLKRLQELEALRDSLTFARLPKKEALSIMREITKLDKSLGGIRDMGGLPDAIFVIDVGHEKIAVSEAAKLKIPIVGVVDTNNSPDGIDYVIPGNDDSIRAISLYLRHIVDAIIEARGSFAEEIVAEKEDKEVKGGKKQLPLKKKVFKKKAAAESDSGSENDTREAEASKPKTTNSKQPVHKVAITKIKSKPEEASDGENRENADNLATNLVNIQSNDENE